MDGHEGKVEEERPVLGVILEDGDGLLEYRNHSKSLFLCPMILTPRTVICFVSNSAKIGICPVVYLNGTLVEAKIGTFKYPKCVL